MSLLTESWFKPKNQTQFTYLTLSTARIYDEKWKDQSNYSLYLELVRLECRMPVENNSKLNLISLLLTANLGQRSQTVTSAHTMHEFI